MRGGAGGPEALTARLFLGTAGWAVPASVRDRFAADGTSLQRYASVFDAAEINSSFHRPHRASTYARWAASVPGHFRFSVKLARAVSHAPDLTQLDAEIASFFAPVAALGDKFGCLLVQLPPRRAFDATLFDRVFAGLARHAPAIAVEPRHASWFEPGVDAFLDARGIARVAAHPPRAPGGDAPGGHRGFAYHRLHGAPRTYYSSYDASFLADLAARLAREAGPAWCMFDNTAGDAAASNALDLRQRYEERHEEK